jgi:hypothetical protein
MTLFTFNVSIPSNFCVSTSANFELEKKIKVEFINQVCDMISTTTNLTFSHCQRIINRVVSIVTKDQCGLDRIAQVALNIQNFTESQLDNISPLCHVDPIVESLNFMDLVVKCLRKVVEISGSFGHNDDDDIEDCHELLSEYNPVLESCKFWLEGVFVCSIAFFGLCGNMLAIIVLGRTKDSNRSE